MRARMLVVLLVFCFLPSHALSEGVFYQIFPGSFYDSNGDGLGDLRGIIEKIDYIQSIGADGIWLTPVHPSPTYHKYDVTDYWAIDPSFGTTEDFVALADSLHARGMALIMDLVVNHTSAYHPWFLEAKNALIQGDDDNPAISLYHFSKEPVPGWHDVPGATGWRYEGSFSSRMPDLNLDNESVREQILKICEHWLEMGADGFRLDAVLSYYAENTGRNVSFVQWLVSSLREMKPDVYVVGEVWKDAGTIEKYYQSEIDSLFNFPFAGPEGAIVKALRDQNGVSLSKKMAGWQSVLSAFPNASDAPFLSNHDIARIAGTLMQKPDRLKLAASLYLTMPGTPFVYYGEEIGMTGSGLDQNKRLPMLWSEENTTGSCLPPTGADQAAKSQGSVEKQLADSDSLLNHYRALIAIRKQCVPLQKGTVSPIDIGFPALCAYSMTYAGETIYVLHNLGDAPVTLSWDHNPFACFNAPEISSLFSDSMLTIPAAATVLSK